MNKELISALISVAIEHIKNVNDGKVKAFEGGPFYKLEEALSNLPVDIMIEDDLGDIEVALRDVFDIIDEVEEVEDDEDEEG